MPQRSPVIFVLLLAATLSVDAVAAYWYWSAPQGIWAKILYVGLTFGQVSVCCIYASLAGQRIRLRWLLPYTGGLVAALGTVPAIQPSSRWSEFFQVLWLYWTHITVLLAFLWLWGQTRGGWRLRGDSSHKRWQISILQLLAVTTIVALTLALGMYADVRQTGSLLIVTWLANTLGIAAVAVATLNSPQPLVRRIAVFAIAAGALAFVLSLGGRLAGVWLPILGVYHWMDLIQAIVLVLWLELSPIIPRRAAVAADNTAQVPPAPSQAE
jgi:hypothetical protein